MSIKGWIMIWSTVFVSLFPGWLPAETKLELGLGMRLKTPTSTPMTFAEAETEQLLASATATQTASATQAAPTTTTTPATDVRHEGPIHYSVPEDDAQVFDIFYPPAAKSKGGSLLLMISGGFVSGRQNYLNMVPMLEGFARNSGYTIFAIQHVSQPQAVIPEITSQITRAIRYIHGNAQRYGIDPQKLAVMGFSSGGYLSLMASVTGDDGVTTSTDPVERQSSRVRAVVAFFPPSDFLNYGAPGKVDLGTGVLAPFRQSFFHTEPPKVDEQTFGRMISPIYHVTRDDAPVLLIHGGADPLVPVQQSEALWDAMKQAGVPCELRIVHGAGHGWADMVPDMTLAVSWLNERLGLPQEDPPVPVVGRANGNNNGNGNGNH